MPDAKSIWIGNQTSYAAATPDEPFRYALANGFDAFEWFPDKKPWGAGWEEADLSPEQRHDIRKTAQAKGLRLSVHARLETNPLEPGLRPLLLRDVELARDLGAALLNVHLHAENGLRMYVESITWLARHLARTGLQLAIENTPLNPPEQFNELFVRLRTLDAAQVGHVGMCLDLGHANLCTATHNHYLGYLARLEPHVPIIHLHLHENWGDADNHLPLFTGPAARDDAAVREFVGWLKRRGYTGSMVLEQWPLPRSRLNQARDALLRMWNESPPQTPDPPAAGEAPGKSFTATTAIG
jgi:sugar phosphate isomerase/epimerase